MSPNPFSHAAHMAHGARSLRHNARCEQRTSLAPARTARDWIAFALLMAAAAFVFFWNLTASGYANEFYSAAAQAGSQSWEAFLWGGLDAGGAITVDKPPASIWLMALSVRLLGLSSFAILLPQALMGVACTYLIYAIVRRGWGNAAGIVAGVAFITTPVAALMFRFNNPDALLVLLMLAATGCVLRGLELDGSPQGNRRRTGWYALAGLCIGLGFLTKQFQVLLVLPGFALAMLLLAPTGWGRRILDAVVALVSMCLGAGWWIALTVLVPSGSRPYFGGSQTDSFIELTFGYNGLGRLTGDETGSVIPGAGDAAGGAGQGGMWGETGITRLWTSDFGDQITWLALLAFAGIVLGAVAVWTMRGRGAGSTDASSRLATRAADDALIRIRRAQLIIFGAWLIVTWLVFSFMAGIFHAYYTVALSPAIAALAAICAASLHELWGDRWTPAVTGLLIALSSAWSMALVLRSGSFTWLGICIGVVGVAAGIALCILAFWMRGRRPSAWNGTARGLSRTVLVLGIVALMAGPVVWTGCTIATGHTGSIVTAGPSSNMGGGPGGGTPGGATPGANGSDGGATDGTTPNSSESDGATDSSASSGNSSASAGTADDRSANASGAPAGGSFLGGGSADSELVELLTSTASDYRWAAATTGSQNAASYQLASELPVMAIGGFNGSDPAPTLDQFKTYVAQGLVKYYIAAGGMGGTQMGGSSAASEIQAWVEENFTAQTIGNTTVYDVQAS